MIDQLKKDMYIGIGLMAMTTDKIKEFAKKLAADSALPQAEGEKLVNDLVKQAEEMKKHFETTFSEVVEKSMRKAKLPCTEGFEKMQKEIAEIKDALARIEAKLDK